MMEKKTKQEVLPLLLTMLWIAGLPTLFVFGNNALASVPVLNVDRALYLVVAGLLAVRALR